MRPFLCLALVLISVVLCGCSGNYGNNYTIGISPEFTSDQIDEITTAVYTWRERTDPSQLHLDMVVMDCDSKSNMHRICMHPSTRAAILNMGQVPSHVIGLTAREYETDSSDIYIALDIIGSDSQLMTETAEHELGHAFGLNHQPKELHVVMCADTGCAAKTITCSDVLQYCDLRDLPLICH
jgi:hypothetical protein